MAAASPRTLVERKATHALIGNDGSTVKAVFYDSDRASPFVAADAPAVPAML